MQLLHRADGTVEAIGSVNHAELAKARAAAKKRKVTGDKAEEKSDDKPDDKPDDKSEPVAEKSEAVEQPKTEAAPPTPPKPATRGK